MVSSQPSSSSHNELSGIKVQVLSSTVNFWLPKACFAGTGLISWFWRRENANAIACKDILDNCMFKNLQHIFRNNHKFYCPHTFGLCGDYSSFTEKYNFRVFFLVFIFEYLYLNVEKKSSPKCINVFTLVYKYVSILNEYSKVGYHCAEIMLSAITVITWRFS